MKNFKKVLSSVLAVSVAATSIAIVSAAEGDTTQLDKDLSAATWYDFEKWDTDVNITQETPGMNPAENAIDIIYTNQQGEFQIKNNLGAAGSKGFQMKETLGEDKDGDGQPEVVNTWSSMCFAPKYNEDSTLNTNASNFDVLGAEGASEFYFYVDLTNYKKYKLIEDEDDNVIGRSEEAKTAPWKIWMGLWDKGTSAGESLTAYTPVNGAPFYIQTEGGNGGNNWTEVAAPAADTIGIPKDYKGYVRIPRTSMAGIWGAYGDVLASEGVDAVGDGLFNGPFEFVKWNGNCGGYEYEGAEKVIDNLGFIGFDFAEGISSVPVEELFVSTAPVTSETPITTESPVTTDIPVTTEEPTSTPEGAKIEVKVLGEVGAGKQVTVSVNIPEGINFAAGALTLTYDKDLLSIATKDVDGELENMITGGKFKGSPVVNADELGKIIVAYASEKPLNVAGSILDVTFNIADTFKEGDIAKINVDITEMFDIGTSAIEFYVVQANVEAPAPVTSEAPVTSTEVPATSNEEPATSNEDTDTTKAPSTTSTPDTSNPNSGATGVAGVASALAVAALATAAAICFKKR